MVQASSTSLTIECFLKRYSDDPLLQLSDGELRGLELTGPMNRPGLRLRGGGSSRPHEYRLRRPQRLGRNPRVQTVTDH